MNDFNGAQLKFKARSRTLGLNYEKRRWQNKNIDCTFPCCGKEDQIFYHFLFRFEHYLKKHINDQKGKFS